MPEQDKDGMPQKDEVSAPDWQGPEALVRLKVNGQDYPLLVSRRTPDEGNLGLGTKKSCDEGTAEPRFWSRAPTIHV
jgi:hypothetical protein